MTAEQAATSGYCIISPKAPTWAARIDRKDWREVMAATHCDGMKWVKGMRDGAADQYRRCHSKDVIVVPTSWIKKLPNSGNGPTEFAKAL